MQFQGALEVDPRVHPRARRRLRPLRAERAQEGPVKASSSTRTSGAAAASAAPGPAVAGAAAAPGCPAAPASA